VCHGNVQAIERNSIGFRIRVGDEWIEAESLILAVPAHAASPLLVEIDDELARLLGGISYTSSLIVSLIYKASEFDGMKAGFGFLIPKKERDRLAACTFVATKFPHRAPEDRLILRCFFGGAGDEAILDESDDMIMSIARQELSRILGLTAQPLFQSVSRWPRAMAQYGIGHLQRAAQIKDRTASIPGLHLAGNAYDGIGIPDCIRSGREAAAEIISAK
jgi:oxygen-dependent protoporphyrinogen oxidase